MLSAAWALQLTELALLAALFSSLVSLGAARWPALIRLLALPLVTLSGTLATLAGAIALLAGDDTTATLPLGLPEQPWRLALDALSGCFLLVFGAVTTAAGLYGPAYVRSLERDRAAMPVLGAFTGLFLAGMLLVLLAADVLVFMIGWELMSLASYCLVTLHHDHPANRRAGFQYLLMAHIGALAILCGFVVLAGFADGLAFADLRAAPAPAPWAGLAFALALFGFGMKAGLVPLHGWLPEAHPVAPSHISALMSAVMLKMAVYGFIRVVFDLNGQIVWQWGLAALILGSLSALLGVLLALMQTDLKRLLAYSSVENLGVIFIALGLALLFQSAELPRLAALALIAALYHVVNHALFKGLLFFGAGAIQHSAHERDLQQMGGLLRRMPWTGYLFLVGCLAIAGLPPLNGFVSEWLTFQAALQAWQLDSGVLRSLVPMASAVLALTAALVAATFVKAFGIAFLGQARSRHVRRARPVPFGMRAAQALLALGCVALGVFAGGVVDLLDPVAVSLFGSGLNGEPGGGLADTALAADRSWLWLTPVSARTASYSAPLVWLLLLGGVLAIWLWWRHQSAAPESRGRRAPPWDCGLAPPTPRMQSSADAFAQPIRRVFAPLFQIDEQLPEPCDAAPRYRLEVRDRTPALLYRPLGRTVQAAAELVTRLQSGSVRVYLGWTLGTLLLLLWIIS